MRTPEITPDSVKKLEKTQKDQLQLVIELQEQLNNIGTAENDPVQEIFDNYIMLNANIQQVERFQRAVGQALKKPKLSLMLDRNYAAGHCYPTA